MAFSDVSRDDLRMGDDLLDAVRVHAKGEVTRSAELVIPHVRIDPILVASVLTSFAAQAVAVLADHTQMSVDAVIDMIWTKPAGDR